MAVQKKYNPYDDVKQISEYKGLYNTAKATGGDYMQYQKAAAKHYNNLIENGYSDVSDELTNMDYDGSLKVLERYSPSNAFEDYLEILNSSPSRENTAGLDPTSSQWQGQAQDFLEASKNPQLSETAQKMYDSYYALENVLNGPVTKDSNGNVVSGLNVDHYNSGKGQLDYLQDFDITKQPYYEGIMAQYKLLGGDAAQGELASGASENSGNIDSFAQANANRQQLAYTTAGIIQALAAANQNQQNWQDVYDRMTEHLNNMGVLNNGKLVEAGKVHETDSVERQNALNTAAGLASQEMENNMKWYLELLGYDTTMDAINREVAAGLYGVDVDADTQKYGYDTGLSQTQLQTDADKYGYDTALKQTQSQADADKYGYDTALKQTQSQADADKYGYDTALKQTEKQTEVEKQAETEQYDYAKNMALEAVRQMRLGKLGNINTPELLYDYISGLCVDKYGKNISGDAISSAISEAIAYWAQYDPAEEEETPATPIQIAEAIVQGILNGQLNNQARNWNDFESMLIQEVGDREEVEALMEWAKKNYSGLFTHLNPNYVDAFDR